MIKGAETIAQYKILQWVEDNFEDGCISVEFTSSNTATLTDKQGNSMNVHYVHTKGVTVVE